MQNIFKTLHDLSNKNTKLRFIVHEDIGFSCYRCIHCRQVKAESLLINSVGHSPYELIVLSSFSPEGAKSDIELDYAPSALGFSIASVSSGVARRY